MNDIIDNPPRTESRLTRIRQLVVTFLKLGSIGFGGPAVHYATIEEEAVHRRGWLTRQHYLDLVGATNLIPGPNSTEIAMHVGYHRAGLVGLVAAGVSFILPAALLTTLFAWIYIQYGQLDFIQPALMGVKPAVMVVIFSAGWRLGKKALQGWSLLAMGTAALAGSLGGFGTIRTLLVVSVCGLLWLRWRQSRGGGSGASPGTAAATVAATVWSGAARSARAAGLHLLGPIATATTAAAATPSLWQLALFFLKVGAVLYGTGYVLMAYLEGGLVDQYHWLTSDQLLDAFAVGNLTPGPILSTATFVGFILLATPEQPAPGLIGALVATVAIFLPSFFFVAVLGPIIPRLRNNRWAGAFLDAVNAASIGLIAAVTLKLCGDIFFSWPSDSGGWAIHWPAGLIAAAAAAAHFRYRISAVWLVLGGAIAGWVFS